MGVFSKFTFFAKTFDLGSLKESDSCVLWWGRRKGTWIYNEASVFSVITPKVIKQRRNFNELSCVRGFSTVWWSWAYREGYLNLLRTSENNCSSFEVWLCFTIWTRVVEWTSEAFWPRELCEPNNDRRDYFTLLESQQQFLTDQHKLPWNQHLLLHLYFSGYKAVVISVRSLQIKSNHLYNTVKIKHPDFCYADGHDN
jgi:hypothetical protein